VSGTVRGPDGPVARTALRLVSAVGTLGMDELAESMRAFSQQDGTFSFEGLPAGEYVLQVGGGIDAPVGPLHGEVVVDGIVLAEGGAVEGLAVRVSRPGTVGGTVRGPSGEPLGGVAIFVRDATGRAVSVSTCTTDAAGHFTHEGVEPGRVTLSARNGRMVAPESAPVEVRAGETSTVELTATEGSFLRVTLLDGDRPVAARLHVVDEARRRVDDLLTMEDVVSLMSEGFSSRERRIGPLAPGRYTVRATALEGGSVEEVVHVEAGPVERRVELRLP